MTVFKEPVHAGEHLVSEANGNRSRSVKTITDGDFSAATVLGTITATEKCTQLAPAAEDGTEAASGILFAGAKAAEADVDATVHDRDCEVNAHVLVWPEGITDAQKEAAIAELAVLGVIVRS